MTAVWLRLRSDRPSPMYQYLVCRKRHILVQRLRDCPPQRSLRGLRDDLKVLGLDLLDRCPRAITHHDDPHSAAADRQLIDLESVEPLWKPWVEVQPAVRRVGHDAEEQLHGEGCRGSGPSLRDVGFGIRHRPAELALDAA